MSEPTGARRYGVGGGDAYYDAVKYGGYEGTREQFGRDQAEFAQNAAAVAEAKEAVEQDAEEVRNTKNTFENTTVPEAIRALDQAGDDQILAITQKGEEVSQQVETVGTEQKDAVANEGRARVQAVDDAGTTQVQNVNDAGTTQVGNVNQAGEEQIDAVEQAGADQVQAVTDEGTTQVGNVTGEGNTQVQRIQDKGDEVIEHIPADYTALDQKVDNLQELVNTFDLMTLEQFPKHPGNLSTTKTWNNINANYQHIIVPIKSGDNFVIKAPDNGNLQWGIITDYVEPVNGESVLYSADTSYNNKKTLPRNNVTSGIAPSDAKYIILMVVYGGSNYTPVTMTVNKYSYTTSAKENIMNAVWENPLKWLSMGDSIAYGYYSQFEEGAGVYHVNQELTWTGLLTQIKHWNRTNIAVGGTGYIYRGSSGTAKNAFEVAEETDFTQYDIVTLAFGTNDWKGNVPTGAITDDITTPSTMIAGMRKTIETIMASNTNIKIIVITPFNCRGYEYAYGDFSTNYALGYNMTRSGTLETAFEAIKSVCEYYGIFYIDETHASAINRLNIVTACPDGVHPSLETHKTIAHEIAGKLAFI